MAGARRPSFNPPVRPSLICAARPRRRPGPPSGRGVQVMAVTRGNGGKRPGSGGGRSRPDFTPSKNKKLFLKLDCMAGRVKIVGHESGELFSRTAVFNADLENIKTGWLDFNANAESSIVGDDRDNPPPGAGERDGPRWGIELPVAMPYSTRFDDIDIKKVDPCLIKSSTGLLLEAVATLWDAMTKRSTRTATSPWSRSPAGNSVTKSGGKKYFKPRLKLLGFVGELEEAFEGVSDDDNDTSASTPAGRHGPCGRSLPNDTARDGEDLHMKRAPRTPLEAKFAGEPADHLCRSSSASRSRTTVGSSYTTTLSARSRSPTASKIRPAPAYSSAGHDSLRRRRFRPARAFRPDRRRRRQVSDQVELGENAGAVAARHTTRRAARRSFTRCWPRRATTTAGSSATWPAAVCLGWRTTSDW